MAALLVIVPLGARAEAGAPRGVHLSYAGDSRTSVTAVWFTDGTTDPGSAIEYGRAPTRDCEAVALDQVRTGTAQPAPGLPVLSHEATMDGLQPGSIVCYRVGGSSGWSPVRATHTAPASSAFEFTAFGDHGTNGNSRTSTAAILAEDPDFHVIAGDISYANGNQPVWDTYFNLTEPLFSTVPVMAALGNHEVEDNFGTQAFRTRMAHPGAELYYSFDYANAHFAFVDGGAALEEAILADELAFLEQDLARAAARKAAGEIDFIIVVQHFPIWSNHDTRGPCDPTLVAIEEQYLVRYGVDVLLTGHNHHFERSKPMAYGQPTTDAATDYLEPAGYVEVITGGGGQSLYNFVAPGALQTWSAAYAKRYHYTRFRVDGPVMRVESIATDAPAGEVLDSWTIRAATAIAQPAPQPDIRNVCASTEI